MRVDRIGYLGWLRAPVRARSGRAPLWILVAVTATGTLAMHILVPVLPLAAVDFGSRAARSSSRSRSSCSASLATNCCMARCPTSSGGGRPFSLGLYIAATAVAGWAAGITTLLIARIGQAVGGGGLVLGRAIVRDSAVAGQAASRMALLTMVQSLAPDIGPAVGGFLGAWFGWRSIFAALVVLGVVTFGGVWRALPETAASRGIAGSGRMLGSYLALRRSRSFRGYMFGGAFTSTSFYAYLTASPFIFTQMLHRPATEVGLYYLVVMSGVPIGSFAVSRLAPLVRLTLLLRATSAIAVLGALLFFVAAASDMLNLATVLLPMILFSVGVGASGPVAIPNAISSDPQMIGAASGLYGFMQMANGALCTLMVGFFPAKPALSAASVLLAGILLGQYFFLRATRRRSGAGG